MGNMQDELQKLKALGIEVPKPVEKKENHNWEQEAEKYQNRSRNNRSRGNRSGGYNNTQSRNPNKQHERKQAAPTATASAPYNFISLPQTVLPSPLDQGLDWQQAEDNDIRKSYKEYILAEGKYTGYIELKLQTVTPCFVGGNGTEFFAPTGQPVIPGSTLRGMTKNLFKIITSGAMRRDDDITDRHLYSRGMAERVGSFRDYYKNRMTETDQNGKDVSKAKPGFLIRVRGEYFVCPADKEGMKIPENEHQDRAGIRWHDRDSSADCITGRAPKEKYIYYRVQKPDWRPEKRIPLDKNVVEDYRADKTRRGLDLFDKHQAKYNKEARGFTHLPDVDYVAPCFYLEQNGKVQHFGHGRYYRIPYETSVGDHIPEAVQAGTIDFADAVFGAAFNHKSFWASRVFFEDAEPVEKPVFLQKNYSHPLMSPNPTSFQLYLKQTDWPPKHWDDDVSLRGYKMYWHQKTSDTSWMIDRARVNPVNGTNEIHPLAKNNHFQGRIRFENLSRLELGALCEVFCLSSGSEEIVYKIGQGKSIGMGSVKIQAKLYLSDEKARYQTLFEQDHWKETYQETDSMEYRQAFDAYRDQHLGAGREAFAKCMKELRAVMNWKNIQRPDWDKKTAMMKIGDKQDRRYKDRAILAEAIPFVVEPYK